MIEDMNIRKFAAKIQHDYIQRVRHFSGFIGRSPDLSAFEDVRRYQLHLAMNGVGVPTINQVRTLRFFFKVTLKRHDIVGHTHFIHEPLKLPMVLSVEEVARLLDAAPGLKYKTALSVAYGACLRVNEVAALKVSDTDSKRMIIRVEQGRAARIATSCVAQPPRAAASLVENGAPAGPAVPPADLPVQPFGKK